MKRVDMKRFGIKRGVALAWAVVLPSILIGCGIGKEDPEPLSSPTFEKALVLLQTQAHSGDPTVRANCVEALQVSHDPRAMDVIEEGLHDKEWVVRFAAAMATGESKAATLRPVLNTLILNDPNTNVRVGCIYGLRRMGDSTHWGDLAKAMENPDPTIRANAALVVAMGGDEADQVLLERYRNDVDVRVRFGITAALARLGNEDAQKVIVSESVNKYAEDQWHAMEVCAYLPPNMGLSPLLMGLQGPPTTAPGGGISMDLTTQRQLIAARSLAKMRNGTGAQVALENLKNTEPAMRALAVLALGDMLTSRQAPGLESMLDDPDERVRRATAAAVVNIYARVGKAPVLPSQH